MLRRAALVLARFAAQQSNTVRRGFPQPEKPQGSRETRGEPAACATAADGTWPGPEARVAKAPPAMREAPGEYWWPGALQTGWANRAQWGSLQGSLNGWVYRE